MPDTIIKGVKEGFEELGSEIKDEAKKAVTGVIGGIPKQIAGSSQNQQQIDPPSDQEVVEHLYGATGKPKQTKTQVKQMADDKQIQATRNAERIRQNLRRLLEPSGQKEMTVQEKLAKEKQEEERVRTQRAKEAPPSLVEPETAQKKGVFGGLFGGKRKKGRKQQLSDLQSGAERKTPGSGIA